MSKKDLLSITVIGFCSGVLALPILRNVGALLSGPIAWVMIVFAVTGCAIGALWVCQQLGKIKPIFSQIGKFAAVGALNTLIDFGILNVLSVIFGIYSGVAVAALNAVGFIAANINSYFWNKFWTFSDSGKKTVQFFEFFGVSLVGILLNSAIVFLMTTYIDPMRGLTGPQWENLAKLLATATSLVWNFVGYKFFVFKKG